VANRYVWLGIGSRAGPCNCGSEFSGFVKSRKYLEHLRSIIFTRELNWFDLGFTVSGVRIFDRYEQKLNSLSSFHSVKRAQKIASTLYIKKNCSQTI
jgi:hypothetical protein